MSLVEINWKPDAKELRKFGVAMIVGFGIIAGVLFWRGHGDAGRACAGFGLLAGVLGLTGTRAALPVYWGWMGVAFIFGNVISRALIALLFYGMITPMGIVMRIVGRDKLTLKRSTRRSYWVDVPPRDPQADYERQF